MRTAAAQRGRPEYLSLWAGTGIDKIRSLPAGELVATLIRELCDSDPHYETMFASG